MPKSRSNDRRIRKTQAFLHEALASLIHEKSYDAIVVKEILARADVGRSTFYSHFRDKNALLESGIHDMLRAGVAASPMSATSLVDRLLRFSLPIFEHIERYRGSGRFSAESFDQRVVHEHLRRALVELIADDLTRASRSRPIRRHDLPCDLLARHVASTFLLVLQWWLESGEPPLCSSRVNDLFRALIVPALTEAIE